MILVTRRSGDLVVKAREKPADSSLVGTDLTETPSTTACPSCGAALRPGAPWCTLCYTDLRPKPDPVAPSPAPPVTPPLTASYGLPAGDPLTQPLVDFLPAAADPAPRAAVPVVTGSSWPCTVCESVNDLQQSLCSACGQPFLAGIKVGDKPVLVLPLLGDLGAMGRGQRAGVALGVVALVLVPLALITLLLTPNKKKDPPVQTPTVSTSTQPSSTGGGVVTDSTVPVQ